MAEDGDGRQTLRDGSSLTRGEGSSKWTEGSACRRAVASSRDRRDRSGRRRTASCAGDGSTSSASSPSGSASPHERYVGKLLKKLGFSHMSARPRHPAQDERIVRLQKNFSRTLSAHLDGLPETTPIEIWFQDEARIGQKNGVRQWAKRGTRPRQPADQRYDNAIFRRICPARGVGAALALPYADTEAMQLHLDEIRAMSPKAPTRAAARPGRMAHDWQPRRAQEHHPDLPAFAGSRTEPGRERLADLRSNWLSNRVFDTYDAIIDAACEAWQKLVAQPDTITSIGMRSWAHVGQSS